MSAPTLTRPADFRGVMRRFPTAVAVLTSDGGDGPHGMTANAVTSLSLDPPLLLACVRSGSRFARTLERAGGFVVNVLGERQSALATWFASPARTGSGSGAGPAEFADPGWRWSGPGGHPRLDGAACVVECAVADLVERGDHRIVIGEVLRCDAADGVRPLLWHAGGYRRLGGACPPDDAR